MVSFVSVVCTVDIGIRSVDCCKFLDSDMGTDMDTGTAMDMGMETDIDMNMEEVPCTRTWIFELF